MFISLLLFGFKSTYKSNDVYFNRRRDFPESNEKILFYLRLCW